MTQPYASKKESKKSSKSPITSLRTANNIPEFQVQTAKTTIPRKTYKTYWDFIISSIGSTVGLGNIWRFPRLTYDHGGMSFIIPYILCLFFVGLPYVCMEMYLGQLSGLGIGKTFGLMVPIFHGVGWGIIIMTFMQSLEYCTFIGYFIFYLFASFRSELPWEKCESYKNYTSKECWSRKNEKYCQEMLNNSNAYYFNKSCRIDPLIVSSFRRVSPAEDYFYNFVLNDNVGEPDVGKLSWRLSTSLMFAWFLVFASLVGGVKFSGKIAYITTVAPMVILIVLMVRIATLEGASDGVLYLWYSNFTQLGESQVWISAVTQVFWSLNIGMGSLTTLTSYNPFHNNCQRDAIIIVVSDTVMSLFCTVTIYAGGGFLAHERNVSFSDVFDEGFALAFIVFPEALVRMSVAPLWSVLFFTMLITLGISSQIWLTETIVSEIADFYHPCRTSWARAILVAVVCTVCYFLGLTFCMQHTGVRLATVVEEHMSGWCIFLLALLECLVVMGIYGFNRFFNNISLILGYKPHWYWRLTWGFSVPLATYAAIVSMFSDYKPVKFRGEYLSHSAERFGWFLSSFVISIVFIFAIYRYCRTRYRKETLDSIVLPSPDWNPRKKADLAKQIKEIETAERGIMEEYEISPTLLESRKDAQISASLKLRPSDKN